MGRKLRDKPFSMEQLEARLMFAADLEPITLDGGRPYQDGMTDLPVIATDLVASILERRNDTTALMVRREIVFIDTQVPDYQDLVNDLLATSDDGRHVEVVLLDSQRDGVEQISKTLSGYQDLEAVHIVSHGRDGSIQLGNGWLTDETVDAYADSIEGWGQALTESADILLYGCDLAAAEEGRALINNLSILTGADVAASDDPTGHTALGGDWILEQRTGDIETAVAFSRAMEQNWSGSLAEYNVTTTTDGGPGSLRQAIIDAASGDTINLPAGTYTLTIPEDGLFPDTTGDL
ncbi:MAG: DUF4347 domain-containing protein, partial [bacterium]|nr:DUF4347 domain-containing protein [bacterium]